jgi:predicted nucleotidyltransferase
MNYHGLPISRDEIADFCRRNRIRKLALFGSILRADYSPQSDIDVLVEFEPGATPGLAFFSMQEELTRLFGRTVDLHTAASLGKYFRDDVLAEAEVQYVAA